jgi:L-lysine 2,3-aminomutase
LNAPVTLYHLRIFYLNTIYKTANHQALVITKTMVEEMMLKNPSVKLRMQSIFAERENELLIHHTREKLYSQGQEFVDNIRSR